MIIKIKPDTPNEKQIEQIIKVLSNGGIIIYPTDTFYGFGASLSNKEAIEKLHKIKNQDNSKYYSFILTDLKKISEFAQVSDYAFRSLKYHLPGPYTFILPASRLIPKKLWSKRKTVGIRIPNNKIVQEITKNLEFPLVSTSVLDKNGDGIFNPDLIDKELENKVDLVINGGIINPNPSSVIDLTVCPPEIIREGAGNTDWFKN